ncbi:GntR family transcriptional regulator [Nonomuraea basaltis]|uniref:GntR family transcriptional regulator n=1 Tax=Nonomuraea basaltis TaxID=2495887 RepID=UPI00110C596E|nr:GntR family transcriptional regulator [Nonomuraea basaltis]TMR95988.1 GntR family transcriptional regulator [Nonomuraea basaltis]
MAVQVGVTIDRSSPVPLYHQLAEQLRAAIAGGRLQPGDQLENEMSLAERLNLARPTVRQAIQELVDRGLVLRRRGIGTTVANPKVHRRAELTSLYDDLTRAGGLPATTVLRHELMRDERVASALDLPADTELLSIVRVRFSADRPLAIMRNWLPPAYHGITREDLESSGLYAVLRKRGARPVVAAQSIGARPPTAPERLHLLLKPAEPVLTMTRTAFDGEGNAVEHGDHCYRAQDYTIEVLVDER